MRELQKGSIDSADKLLNLSHRELLAHSLQEDERWRGNFQMAMIVKNQQANERLVRATWILAIGTLILSGLTLLFNLSKL